MLQELSLLVVCFLLNSSQSSHAAQQPKIRVEANQIIITPRQHLPANDIVIDTSIFQGVKPDNCSEGNNFCRKWGDFAKIKITNIDDKCQNVMFKSKLDESLTAQFNLVGLHLYGGPEMDNQSWPVGVSPLENVDYVSTEVDSHSVLESYWLDSKGQYVYVDENVPLFVSQSLSILKLTASRQAPYMDASENLLKFKVCSFDNPRTAHMHAIATVLGKPSAPPDFRMIQWPVWSTWAKYKSNISEEVVLEFADLISQHGFPSSQIEIDDMWETCYGSLTVDKTRFPDMKRLVSQLKDSGYRVTIWAHPFINVGCEPYFTSASNQSYLIKSQNGNVVTSWWNGEGSYIDFTNPAAANWWSSRLRSLLVETGINSVKFDAGESAYSPQLPVFHTMSGDYPETNLAAYVKTSASFGDMIEVRVGRKTQRYSPFVRMMDRETIWGNYGRGLQTMIPTLLQMNIVGYPYVLPDMIGGNGYRDHILTEEMFLRWLQINVFMPALQFSYPPWEFSQQTAQITKKYIDLHAKYANKIYGLMVEATKSGTPVNLPLWWIDPKDEVAHAIGSEFLLGEDTLVAPVLEEGARRRDIYLPKGMWKDENNHNSSDLISGPTWLKNYEAELDVLPYFSRISNGNTRFSLSRVLVITMFIPTLLAFIIF